MPQTRQRVRRPAAATTPASVPVHGAPSRRRAGSPIREARSPAGVLRREAHGRWALAAADALAAALALVVGVVVLGEAGIRPAAIALLPAVLLGSKLSGLYDRDDLVLHKTTLDEAPHLFQLATLYALLISVSSGTFVSGSLAPHQVVGLWLAFASALLLCRWAARRVVRAVELPERCLCIGDRDAAERVCRALAQHRHTRAEVVAVVPLRAQDAPGVAAAESRHELRELVESLDVHRVIVTPGGVDSEPVLEAVRTAKALGVRVSILPRIFELVGSSARFDQIDGMTMLGVRRLGLSRSSALVKRGVDLVGASLLLILCAPLLLLAALAIKLDSSGPVFFRQTRVGRDEERFRIVKFRTMVADAEARKEELRALSEVDGLFKIARDPRITRVGCWLRSSSLDELPQLVNVLRGEMSLVGPRPLVLDEDCRIQGWHRRRLDLKPGMTGHWQILGSGRIPLSEMVKIDHLYLANWSLWLDLKILIRTVAHVLGRQGV